MAFVGMRPCDARALLLLDAVLIQGRYRDPYYARRREGGLVVSLACEHPRKTCFCHALGSGPFDPEGSDVLLCQIAPDAFLAKAVTPVGERVLHGLGLELASEGVREEAEERAARAEQELSPMEPIVGLEERALQLFDDVALWRRLSASCLACGTCTYVCPTCHCFDIQDSRTVAGVERVRAWDSCMYPLFTRHASGHNPRPDQAARWRQRLLHKFAYLPANTQRYGCVGCGRCVLSCPVNLDIRRALQMMLAALSMLASQEAL